MASIAGLVLSLAGTPFAARAAEPTPTAVGGDPRSAGEGPGLVGDPLLAIGGVLVIALVAVALTLAWVRLTSRRGDDRTHQNR